MVLNTAGHTPPPADGITSPTTGNACTLTRPVAGVVTTVPGANGRGFRSMAGTLEVKRVVGFSITHSAAAADRVVNASVTDKPVTNTINRKKIYQRCIYIFIAPQN